MPPDAVAKVSRRRNFLIFEEDFEFTDSNRDKQLRRQQRDQASSSRKQSDIVPSSSKRTKLRPVPLGLPTQPSRSCRDPSGKTTFASDLVVLLIRAARAGVGGFVWLGFQPRSFWKDPEPKGGPSPHCGSQAVAVSREGATSILANLSAGEPDDIDVFFRNWTEKPELTGGNASFLWPPLGSYFEHETECCPDQVKVRKNMWQYAWCTPGTRPSHDPKGRPKMLRTYPTAKDWKTDVMVELKEDDFDDDETAGWKTYLAPGLEGWTTSTGRQHRAAHKQQMLNAKFRHVVEESEKVVVFRRQYGKPTFSIHSIFALVFSPNGFIAGTRRAPPKNSTPDPSASCCL